MAQEIKLFSALAEKRALKTLCAGTKQSAMLAATLTEEHFATEIAGDAYRRFKFIQQKRNVSLKWRELLEDSSLPTATRRALEDDKSKVAKTSQETDLLLQTLKSYRKRRGMKDLGETLKEQAGNGDIDPDEALANGLNAIATINLGANDFRVNIIGKKDNTLADLKRILLGEVKRHVPTGFKSFDDRNRGLLLGSLMLIAANTGGGKSILCNKLGRNMALAGAKVGIVPLEMENDDMLVRTMAEEAHIDMTKFLDPKTRMTAKEKDHITTKYIDLKDRIAKTGGQLQLIQPDEDVDIDTLLMYAKPMALDVLIIDYIGLLKGADGDDQPRALSRICRTCKRWASINKTIVILAAQLSDEGEVRYSRAMVEHASNLWKWNYTQHSRDTKTIRVQQPKARQQDPFDFWLYMDTAFMEVRDMTKDEMKAVGGEMSDERRESSGKGKFDKKDKGKKKKDYFADI